MKSRNANYKKSEDVLSAMGIGAVKYVKDWLKNHDITAKSIERWDKVSEDGEPILAYFKAFVSQENDSVFPESFPDSDIVITFEIHQ